MSFYYSLKTVVKLLFSKIIGEIGSHFKEEGEESYSQSIKLAVTEMVPDLIWAPDFFCPHKIWALRNLVAKKFGPREIWAKRN